MPLLRPLALATAIVAVTAGVSPAQDANSAVGARQGVMRVIAMNLGVLGGMAQGKIDYDAEKAQAAADNLATISSLHIGIFFPEGSDNGAHPTTRAAPAIWSQMDGFDSKWTDLHTQAQNLQSVAANGQEALGPAIGPVGGTCKACHDDFRGPER